VKAVLGEEVSGEKSQSPAFGQIGGRDHANRGLKLRTAVEGRGGAGQIHLPRLHRKNG